MRFQKLITWAGILGLLAGMAGAAETQEQRDARMQWWRDAKFGMFIHYGLYSGLAGELDGKKYGGGVEWIQAYSGKESGAYAKATLPLFKPQKGCAAAWIDLAKEAGCKYAVLTTKHHEGFSLFDSRVTDFNSKKTNDFDIVREYVDSCRKDGVKVGFYHSVIDWHSPDYDWKKAASLPYPGGNKETHTRPDHEKYQKFLHAQAEELVSRYGTVDVLWWDYSSAAFDGEKAWKAPELIRKVRAKQPGIIMNNRLYASHNTEGPLVVTEQEKGDFTTPEQHIPDAGVPGDWEVCMTLNGTWGYSAHNHDWKSNDTLIHGLADTVSKGGNFLLNIGPKADGSLPEESIKSFKAIGEWMKINGDAIYGTRANPFGRSFPWGVVTQKGDSLFLIIYTIPESGKLSLPFQPSGEIAAVAMKDMDKKIPVQKGKNGITLDLSGVTPVPSATVVKVTGKGKVLDGVFPEKVACVDALESADGPGDRQHVKLLDVYVLAPESAHLGEGQKLENQNGLSHVGFWTKASPLAWRLNSEKAGKYEVSISYACQASASGTPVTISLTPGNSSLVWKVAATGDWKTFKSVKIGTVDLPEGKCTLTLTPGEAPKIGVANIREVILTPVAK